jgi:hypothetical protein
LSNFIVHYPNTLIKVSSGEAVGHVSKCFRAPFNSLSLFYLWGCCIKQPLCGYFDCIVASLYWDFTVILLRNTIYWDCFISTVFQDHVYRMWKIFKRQWKQKLLMSHLKEHLKLSLKCCYTFFMWSLTIEIFDWKQRAFRHLGLILHFINCRFDDVKSEVI